MELAKPIEAAPKNGDFVILQDACSWEVGRWAPEAGRWVQSDGTPVRIFPTCWARISGDVPGATDLHRLPFLASPLLEDEPAPPQERPRTGLILAFATAVFCAGGLGFWIGSEESSPPSTAPAQKFSQQRDRVDEMIRGLTAARDRQNVELAEALESKRIAEARQKDLQRALDASDAGAETLASELSSARERDKATLAEAMENKRIADTRQRDLKQALEGSEARADALARELASARENTVTVRNLTSARERDKAALAEAIESKRIAEARQKDLKQALNESEARAETLARELASARENAVTVRHLTTARERDTAALAEAIESKRIAETRQQDLKHALDASEARAETLARELASVRETIASAGKPASAEVSARYTAAPTGAQPIQPQPAPSQSQGAIPSADEAKLIARAESLIRQSDFASARLLLEHAMEKGSARAAFMMAETYDWQILRSLQAYGARGDAQMAREFYELAAAAGIEKARERVDALQSGPNADTSAGAEKRTR